MQGTYIVWIPWDSGVSCFGHGSGKAVNWNTMGMLFSVEAANLSQSAFRKFHRFLPVLHMTGSVRPTCTKLGRCWLHGKSSSTWHPAGRGRPPEDDTQQRSGKKLHSQWADRKVGHAQKRGCCMMPIVVVYLCHGWECHIPNLDGGCWSLPRIQLDVVEKGVYWYPPSKTKDIIIFGCQRVWELLKPRYINLHVTLHNIFCHMTVSLKCGR